MACTLRKRKKILPEQIWDHCARKLCIEIIEADDICTAKKNTYCKIYCGRYHVRTTTKKKTANPRWNELFYLEPKETDIIRIEVFYAKRLSDYLIGEVILGTVSTMKRETVYCSWREVVSKKRGNIGKLHLAFYFSTMLETRELSPPSCNQFFYKSYQDKMKTGDLIAYGGTGIIAAATKLVNNSEYSHLGLILNIPNKWTEERELFVMEIGRNNDGFLDAFFEEPRQGVTIHRLFERLHHFHGKSIDWIPLANTLSEENTQSLEDYAVNIHMAEDPFPYTLAGPVIDLLAQFGIGRNKFSVCDLYGPYIIASALMEGGITIRIDPKHCTLRDIITLPHLGKPVTLRKIDKSASSTVKHVRPIYPTKKTIRRKDPNEQPGSSFSLQEFSQTNLSVSQTDSTFSLKKTPFRKSSSFNESPRHSPPGQIPAFADPKGIKPTVPTSLPDFSRDITPVLPKVSPRDRASTTATERANLKPNNPNIPGYLLYPPEINLSKSASEIINKNNNQSIKAVSQPQPIFHPPLNLNDSCDSTSSMSDTTSPEVEENPVLVIDQWNDFRDNSNDVTIKL